MNVPSIYPTTSDISLFMRHLGYSWSNEAQIYFHKGNYETISRASADGIYKVLIGNQPFEQNALHNRKESETPMT